ncbi:hypothetical protein D1872_328530 [compost metagenome]
MLAEPFRRPKLAPYFKRYHRFIAELLDIDDRQLMRSVSRFAADEMLRPNASCQATVF